LADQKPVYDAIAKKKRIIDDIAIIKSYLPKTYGFKKSVKKTKKKSVTKTKKKSVTKTKKKSPKTSPTKKKY